MSSTITDDVKVPTGPCPSWCIHSDGHDFDSVTRSGEVARFHESRNIASLQLKAGEASLNLCAEERAKIDGSATFAAPPWVALGMPYEYTMLSAEEAEQLGMALIRAASHLTRLS